MLDGLGLAESTPGPLIMVVQFVGFMAAFAAPSGLDPFAAGAIGGLLVTWVTFVPSFTFIYAGAPYAEYLRRKPTVERGAGRDHRGRRRRDRQPRGVVLAADALQRHRGAAHRPDPTAHGRAGLDRRVRLGPGDPAATSLCRACSGACC